MIHTAQDHVPTPPPTRPKGIALKDILAVERIAVSMRTSSKKRLFENVAALLIKDTAGMNENTVLRILIDRERLGSTAIGRGVALPHGRVAELDEPVGAFVTLEQAIDFDAIDQQPVTMVFALLVPAQANQEHLELLAQLAKMFNDPVLRDALTHGKSADEIYDSLTSWDGKSAGSP